MAVPPDDSAPPLAQAWPARRISPAGAAAETVRVAEETAVAMVYNGVSHAVMIATPADLEELGLGFSLSEGILEAPSELLDVETRAAGGGFEVAMTVTARRAAALAERRRTLAGRTGCGLCGVDSLAQVVRPLRRLDGGPSVAPEAIRHALAGLRDHQSLTRETGAAHAAAWVAADGAIVAVREDVGRHNALDKLLGMMARAAVDPESGFVALTSRCSFEMVQKSATCGVGMLVAISAPTALALRTAEEAGVTVVGLARSDSMLAYTHDRRLAL